MSKIKMMDEILAPAGEGGKFLLFKNFSDEM